MTKEVFFAQFLKILPRKSHTLQVIEIFFSVDRFEKVFDIEYKYIWEHFDSILCSPHFAQLRTVKMSWRQGLGSNRDSIQKAFQKMLPRLYNASILAIEIDSKSKFKYIV